MIPNNRISTHPGKILLREFLEPLNLTSEQLAGHLDVSSQLIGEIIDGNRAVSPEIAWLFSQSFETTPEFWLNLQTLHDLSANRPLRQVTPIAEAVS